MDTELTPFVINARSFFCVYSFYIYKQILTHQVIGDRLTTAGYTPRELVAVEVMPTKNALGESPVWSDRDQALYWVS